MFGVEYVEAIILGAVQGIAEFLPISSSGHLVILGELIQRFTGREVDAESNLRMNVALHVGTLLSIFWVYRKDLWELRKRPAIVLGIIVATLPLVAIGLSPLKDAMKEGFNTPLIAGCCLLVTAALLASAHRWEANNLTLDEMSPWRAGVIGLFQAIALFPGISRSGSTISGGLLLGFRRDVAANFSFFIAIPAIAGAAVLTLKDALTEPAPVSSAAGYGWGPILVGTLVSFVVGLLALKWLLRLISQRRLHWFAWYCATVGILTIIWQVVEG
ncbi:MAG: undecaprenyl-diphosphate phosphatase [Planctomycetaceae bacterium]|nr:undecaprenyl-diphosphate phosphatase [Planctomycetaceae bacterium]